MMTMIFCLGNKGPIMPLQFIIVSCARWKQWERERHHHYQYCPCGHWREQAILIWRRNWLDWSIISIILIHNNRIDQWYLIDDDWDRYDFAYSTWFACWAERRRQMRCWMYLILINKGHWATRFGPLGSQIGDLCRMIIEMAVTKDGNYA